MEATQRNQEYDLGPPETGTDPAVPGQDYPGDYSLSQRGRAAGRLRPAPHAEPLAPRVKRERRDNGTPLPIQRS